MLSRGAGGGVRWGEGGAALTGPPRRQKRADPPRRPWRQRLASGEGDNTYCFFLKKIHGDTNRPERRKKASCHSRARMRACREQHQGAWEVRQTALPRAQGCLRSRGNQTSAELQTSGKAPTLPRLREGSREVCQGPHVLRVSCHDVETARLWARRWLTIIFRKD